MISGNLSLKYKKKAKQFKYTPPCVPSVKYIKLGRKTVYQFTAVDLDARYSWRQIYEDKTPSSALSFLKYVLKTSPFKIKAIQTDNGLEYTYRCINSSKINIFDEYCLKNKLERRYIPNSIALNTVTSSFFR